MQVLNPNGDASSVCPTFSCIHYWPRVRHHKKRRHWTRSGGHVCLPLVQSATLVSSSSVQTSVNVFDRRWWNISSVSQLFHMWLPHLFFSWLKSVWNNIWNLFVNFVPTVQTFDPVNHSFAKSPSTAKLWNIGNVKLSDAVQQKLLSLCRISVESPRKSLSIMSNVATVNLHSHTAWRS